MPSLPTSNPLRHGLARWLAPVSVGVGLAASTATAVAHPGPHAENASAVLSHVLQSPDHQLTGLMLLAVAAILTVSGIRLWRGQARADRRVLSGACLIAAALIVWSVWQTGAPLST